MSHEEACSDCRRVHAAFERVSTLKSCLCLHLDLAIINNPAKKNPKKKAERDNLRNTLRNKISAIRNNLGGHLLVHLHGLHEQDRYYGLFDELVDDDLDQMIDDGAPFAHVYSKTWLSESEEFKSEKEFLVLTIESGTSISIATTFTKQALDSCIKEASVQHLRYLKTSLEPGQFSKENNVRARSSNDEIQVLHESQSVQLKSCDKLEEDILQDVHKLADFIWCNLRLREYISSFSKNRRGGSLFIGVKEEDKTFYEGTRKIYTSKQTQLQGINFVHFEPKDLSELILKKSRELGIFDTQVATQMEDHLQEVKIPSLDHFRLPIYENTGALKRIIQHVKGEGRLVAYPEGLARMEPEKRLLELLKRHHGKTFVYLGKSLANTLNVPTHKPQPDLVLFDACIIVSDQQTLLLTIIKDNSDAGIDNSLDRYNQLLAKEITTAIKTYSKQHFALISGIVNEAELQTWEDYTQAIERISKSKCLFLNYYSLQMHESKWEEVVNAFIAAVAVSKPVIIDGKVVEAPTRLQVLSFDQFCNLADNIDKTDNVKVLQEQPEQLMIEFARRLSRTSKTLLICSSQQLCEDLRRHSVVSYVIGVDDLCQAACSEFRHVVTDTTEESLTRYTKDEGCNLFRITGSTEPEDETSSTLCDLCQIKSRFSAEDIGNALIQRGVVERKSVTSVRRKITWKTLLHSINIDKKVHQSFLQMLADLYPDISEGLDKPEYERQIVCTCHMKDSRERMANEKVRDWKIQAYKDPEKDSAITGSTVSDVKLPLSIDQRQVRRLSQRSDDLDNSTTMPGTTTETFSDTTRKLPNPEQLPQTDLDDSFSESLTDSGLMTGPTAVSSENAREMSVTSPGPADMRSFNDIFSTANTDTTRDLDKSLSTSLSPTLTKKKNLSPNTDTVLKQEGLEQVHTGILPETRGDTRLLQDYEYQHFVWNFIVVFICIIIEYLSRAELEVKP